MKIILVVALSVDGKSTKHNSPNIYHWTSKEDSKYFFSLIKKNNLIIMGSKTYITSKQVVKLSPKILRVVLTKTPKQFANEQILSQLEFSNEPPKILIKRLEQNGYKQALLVGGAATNAIFVKHNLVNELWITIEPKLFGRGNELLSETKLDVNLQLKSVKKLNQQGTLLLKYKISN